jgi:hypothetical protein
MILHFCVYRKNIRHFESKEGPINICVLHHRIYNLHFLCTVFDNQYVCFYFLNISVGMENEKAVFLLCILALLYQSHQIDGHCCEIMISWRVQKGRQYKKTKHFFSLPPIILLLSLHLSSSLPPSYSFSCHCLFPHLRVHFLQLFSLFIFVILVSLQLRLS